MTKAESAWLNAITRLGCIVCRLFHDVFSPGEVHHLLSGGRRIGHRSTICLCFLHHRSGRNDEQVVSRDQCQRRFEARYGTEASLLEETKRRVG